MKKKWIALTFYAHCGTIYCIFGRMKKSGMVQFRVKRVTSIMHYTTNHPSININDQWQKIVKD